MMKTNHLRAFFGIVLGLSVLAGAPALQAKTRKGEKLLRDGKLAEAKGDWDTALGLYEQAIEQDPQDTGYVIAMRRARFEAGQKHVNQGHKLRLEGKLQEALQEFQKALIADPSSAIAIQEIRHIQDLINGGPRTGLKPEDLGLTPAELGRRESDQRVNSMLEPPELKPMTAVIPTLKMNNQPPRILYETVGKLAGANVVFDSQYTPPTRNFNVDLSNASASQAFDYLAMLTHTFWKPISSNTIFVAEDNVTKRRDYEDDVVKIFYVTNATSVQEFQEIATAVRTVAEIRRVFTYNAQKAMIVRDTVDKVALAEKLVHDLDKPKSEVVVDVMVMEANSERTRDLAATIASAGAAGLNVPITFNGTGTTSTTTTVGTPSTAVTTPVTTTTTTPTTTGTNFIPLSRLAHLSTNQFTTTLPGGLLEALLTDSRTKVLNNPQVRASDGQKVTLKIGNRIPYATGSFGSTIGGVGAGVSPLVSTQFNYADVGVSVDMTPQVHSADEVTLHLEVTVSSVQQYISIGGISQPVIGQRTNTADIRLREGEVNILGGLSQTQDSNNISGIPGLVNIPVLGKTLFGSEHVDKTRGELLIALVPHIVRTPDYTAENLRGIYAGTDQIVKLNYAPKQGETPLVAAPAPSGGGGAIPAPAPAPASPAPPQPAAPPPGALAPATPQGPARISFVPAAIQSASGSTTSVNLQIENVTDLASVSPLRIKFDPAQMRLDDIAPGDLFSRDGARLASVKDIRNDVGEATITITRPPGLPGVAGTGSIAVLSFTLLANGRGTVTIPELGLMSAQTQPLSATTGELPVTVQ
jgi:general secretion pathway protein D